ncbi:glycosyltransferase 1 domain-containing protein 1-like [Portunus trituberculatus]|uniref:glycosyltransferase 1 domain-containing protein 1-like n=1 Tax=Portunus trituberculatus TaxID=210409 RepID=UPI001E1CC518|nr:glycosyltransferase 1 domain-containing protein 1-like [Portunus trituberculatus]
MAANSTVLLVGKCLKRETGNATTLARFGRALRSGGWEAVTRDPDSIPHTDALRALTKQYNIITVLGLHAYRTSHVLLACQELGVPYVTVFGGTDVNECVRDAVKKEVMGRVVAGAKSLVAFHDSMRDAALQVWPSILPNKIWIMPQAVVVDPNLDFDVLSYLNAKEAAHVENRAHSSDHDTATLHHENKGAEKSVQSAGRNESTRLEECSALGKFCTTENVPPHEGKGATARNENVNTRTNGILCKPQMEGLSGLVELPALFQPLVLMVAGLRPVKDVLFLTEAWSEWQQARGGYGRFLIVGPSLDPHYADHVLIQVSRLSGVRVCPSLTPRECQAVIRNATVLVNSSRSESMASSIMEAMALGECLFAHSFPDFFFLSQKAGR